MIDGIPWNDTSSKGGIKSLMKCYQIRNRGNSLRYTAEINLALFIIDHEARDVDGNLFKKNCEQETETLRFIYKVIQTKTGPKT